MTSEVGSEEAPGYRWVILGTFTVNYAMVVTAVTTLGLLLPEISDELDLSPSQQGWLASSVLFANLVFEVPFNWWLSRFRPWRVASVSFGAASLFIVFNAWAPTFGILLIARVALGVIYLSSQTPRTLIILQWMPRKHIALANGVMFCIIDALIGVGTIVIPLILVLVGGWRNTLLTWAVVCLVFALLWMALGRDRFTSEYRDRMRSQVDTPLRSILRYKQTWLLGLGIFGSMLGMTAYKSFWPTFAQDDLAFSVTAAGFVLGLSYIAMAPTELTVSAVPYLTRHRWAVLLVCGLAQCLSFIGLLSTSSLPLLLLFGMANGAGLGYIPVVFTMLYQLPGIKPREVAVAIGLVYTLLWTGGALGPLVVGFVQEATNDLKLGLLLTAFGPLTLAVAGLLVSEKGEHFTAWALSWPKRRAMGIVPK